MINFVISTLEVHLFIFQVKLQNLNSGRCYRRNHKYTTTDSCGQHMHSISTLAFSSPFLLSPLFFPATWSGLKCFQWIGLLRSLHCCCVSSSSRETRWRKSIILNIKKHRFEAQFYFKRRPYSSLFYRLQSFSFITRYFQASIIFKL